MTLRLILTRHAKSSWKDSAQKDHDRPLNGRGRVSATALGDWLANRGYLPDQVLCSSAARTQETWARLASRLPAPTKPDIIPALYLADPGEMLGELAAAKGANVMLIAHNPGSAWLADRLAKAPPLDMRFHQYPTAATTIFEFGLTNWTQIGEHKGDIIDFVVPRDLI